MGVPFDTPVVCPVLIGRAVHLEALETVLTQAQGGSGWTVLLAGEAGIGKSRLVAETTARAVARGFLLLTGHCFEPDRAFPYSPLIDLLRSVLSTPPAQGPAPVHSDILPPELALLLPELRAGAFDGERQAALEARLEQRRLFHALTHAINGISPGQPRVVVIEDLHWCDDTSLEFLHYLARSITAQPVLLLLTYRSDEVNPNLAHFLAGLDRERLAAEIRLTPLSPAEVDAMLRAILEPQRRAMVDVHYRVRTELRDVIYELTEGNPFFIEEVLRTLLAAGDLFFHHGTWERKPIATLRVPRSVQDAVAQRAAGLSPEAQRVLELAAVAGRRFDFTLLQRLLERDERHVLQLIKELLSAQLVVEESAERFAFRHALTRQAVYGHLVARERIQLHRAIAEALEAMSADAHDGHQADLAYHFFEAGSWTKTVAYAEAAGERALQLHAPHAAIEQFTRALDAARQLGVQPSAKPLRGRGLAYEIVGEFDRARADHEAALQVARAASDRQAEWQALLDLGLLWASRDYGQASRYYDAALALARRLGDPAALARSLNRVGNWYSNLEQPTEALRHHREALELFEHLDDQRGIAESLDLLGMASTLRGDFNAAVEYYAPAVDLFREIDDRQGLVSSAAMLAQAWGKGLFLTATTAPASLAFDVAVHYGELALTVARETGWRAGEVFASLSLAMAFGPRGDYGQAFHHAQTSLEIADEIEHHQWATGARCVLALLQLDLLAPEEAGPHLEQALARARTIGSRYWIGLSTALLATAALQARDLVRAAELLGSVVDLNVPPRTIVQLLCRCVGAELELARHHPAQALAIVEPVLAATPDPHDQAPTARLLKLRGEALAALGRTDEAEAVLQAMAETAAVEDAVGWHWRLRVSLGNLYRTQGRLTEAAAAFAEARAIIDRIAITVPDETRREQFLQRTARLLPEPRQLTPRQAAKQAFGGLTSRERDVAALVAEGKSNRAIAEQLFVTERTVAAHVSSILSKLGFTSRAQIAAWASEHRLKTTQE